jgi:hypothetical protein
VDSLLLTIWCNFGAKKGKIFRRECEDIKEIGVRCQWLTPVILATQEAEIRRIMV